VSETPHFATIIKWCEITGFGRRTTYEWIAAGRLRAVKVGRRTLIDVQHGLEQIRQLPPAQIRMSPQAARRAAREADAEVGGADAPAT
jgi:excisionase family DNA binding protein